MITYVDSITSITEDHLQGFFEGWPSPPSPTMHLELLANSDHVVLATDADSRKVAGYIAAISDGVLTAHITFLEVLPARRGQGIGQELMRRMLERVQHLYVVSLLFDAELQPFCARFGMESVCGMARWRFEGQPGTALTVN